MKVSSIESVFTNNNDNEAVHMKREKYSQTQDPLWLDFQSAARCVLSMKRLLFSLLQFLQIEAQNSSFLDEYAHVSTM